MALKKEERKFEMEKNAMSGDVLIAPTEYI